MAHTPEQAKAIKELETEIRGLIDKFGMVRVNLIYPDDSSEGLWATPVTKKDLDAEKDDNSTGETINVRILNQPIGWNNCGWGMYVVAKTQGDKRCEARLEYQESVKELNATIRRNIIGEEPTSKEE